MMMLVSSTRSFVARNHCSRGRLVVPITSTFGGGVSSSSSSSSSSSTTSCSNNNNNNLSRRHEQQKYYYSGGSSSSSSSRGSSSMMMMTTSTRRSMSTKVAVLGANGGIGQPLSMLLKISHNIDELACYDIVGTPGVAADLSHIPTKSMVTGNLPSSGSWPPSTNSGLEETLKDASLVVIPAGVPRKPGMTRDDLFNTNAGIVKTLVEGVADYCPDAVCAIISNPVNSTVPIAAEVLKSRGVYNPKKLCGVTTLDVIRANTFIGKHMNVDPSSINVTVIGGHAGITILPLFSQLPGFTATSEQLEALTVRTQFGGDEVVKAKAGSGSATLSMAYAGYLFSENVVKALKGAPNVIQCAFVESSLTDAPYFASPCQFGTSGIEEVKDYGTLSDYEQNWFHKMIPDLQKQIQKGIDFVKK